MTRLSKHFTEDEVLYSSTALKNNINNKFECEEHRENATRLLDKVVEPIREHFKTPIDGFNSFYRCKTLNNIVSKSKNSQHTKGEAVDIEVNGISNYELGLWIYDNLEFDQLIFEYNKKNDDRAGWIHVSYKKDNNRKQALKTNSNGTYTILDKKDIDEIRSYL